MATVAITMSVDGVDALNETDLHRLKEVWEHYNPSFPPSQAYDFDRLKDQVQSALNDHVRRNPTWFGSRPIYVQGAMSHRLDDFNRHIVILPKRVTWDVINRGYDYLREHHDRTLDTQEWDSMIRHWAGDNLAKYLDVHGGFSRNTEDRQDLFNLILVLDKARRNTYGQEEVIGSTFDYELHGNLEKQREDNLFYLVHRCKPLPM